jgi:hypothetical protein
MSCTEFAAQLTNNKLLSLMEEEEHESLNLPPYASRAGSLRVTNPDETTDSDSATRSSRHGMHHVDSDTSVYSTSSLSSSDLEDNMNTSTSSSGIQKTLGNLNPGDKANSQEEIVAVLGSARAHFDGPASGSTISRGKSLRSAKSILRNTRSEPGVLSNQVGSVGAHTPRMEGVGSGARTLATQFHEKRHSTAAERLNEQTRTNNHASGVKCSISAFLPDSCMDEDEKTPRLGYSSMRESRHPRSEVSANNTVRASSSEPGSDSDRPLSGQRSFRQLPCLPASSGRRSSVHMPATQNSLPLSQSYAIPPPAVSRILPTPPTADQSIVPPASVIPPVPPIPAHILAMCTRKPGQHRDPPRKAIIRPPRSPLRALGHTSSSMTSSEDSGHGVKGRIAALEDRVKSSMEGVYACY